MSTTTTAAGHGPNYDAAHGDKGHIDANSGHHDPNLAHHFDTPEQQFSTSKLGMWTFLATEVLMFGGLFCAYAVYRYNHPEVFLWSHHALDAKWGMINTIVLLASSFTMAWGVRAAQLNKQGLLKLMLILTFLGGVLFMVIKTVEYKSKWQHYLFPGYLNSLNASNTEVPGDAAKRRADTIAYVEKYKKAGDGDAHGSSLGHSANPESAEHSNATAGGNVHQPEASQPVKTAPNVVEFNNLYVDGNAGTADFAAIHPPAFSAAGINLDADKRPAHKWTTYTELQPADRAQLNTFFSIYFMMTGLHGVHVVVGMGIMVWLYLRAARGDFSSGYFTPVDLGGLYWHLVDLIWIFLFPLLYLIH